MAPLSKPGPHSGSPGLYVAHWQYPHSEHTGASSGHPSLEPAQQAPSPVPQIFPPAFLLVLLFELKLLMSGKMMT